MTITINVNVCYGCALTISDVDVAHNNDITISIVDVVCNVVVIVTIDVIDNNVDDAMIIVSGTNLGSITIDAINIITVVDVARNKNTICSIVWVAVCDEAPDSFRWKGLSLRIPEAASLLGQTLQQAGGGAPNPQVRLPPVGCRRLGCSYSHRAASLATR